MRCSCPECDTYMVHAESMVLGCVCPDCGTRCTACLGTNTVISRDDLLKMKNDQWFEPSFEGTRPEAPAPRDDEEYARRSGW